MDFAVRIATPVRIVVLAAVLLAPLIASTHHHGGETATTGACAACLVAYHAPATLAPDAPSIAIAIAGRVALPTALATPAPRVRSPISGRAPPLSPVFTAS
jgi:hypothetical protein